MNRVRGVRLTAETILEGKLRHPETIQITSRIIAFCLEYQLLVTISWTNDHSGTRGFILGREINRDRRVVDVAYLVILCKGRIVFTTFKPRRPVWPERDLPWFLAPDSRRGIDYKGYQDTLNRHRGGSDRELTLDVAERFRRVAEAY